MKSAQITDPSIVSLSEVPIPVCRDGDVLIQLGACGICGSDITNIFGSSCKPSIKIGHEISGKVVKVGFGVKDFQVGDRVFVHHHTSCNDCYLCKNGNETMCERFTDSLYPNGLSEMFLLPKWNVVQGCLFKIPDSMSFENASLIEPFACCVRAWKKAPKDVTSVAIFGLGTIGIFHAFLGRIFGAEKIFCIDMNEFRLGFCRQRGIGLGFNTSDDYAGSIFSETDGVGVDLAIVAAPDMSAIKDAIRIVRKGGSILIMGEPEKSDVVDIDLSVVYGKEISIFTSYAASNNDVQHAFDLIKSKKIDVSQIITHRFSLDECEKALDVAKQRRDSIKVVIVNAD
ncbi:MAG: alcohol dehydrogenase catalytic domain-containing protein [Thaumarchaeota archaeon]|nr:alcohol dehydrogenase catalytic domain-containing protein [Nitrososphaerota archaeon]